MGLALMAMMYLPALPAWWARWFPAWGRSDLSWWQGLTQGDARFSHGPLVLLATAILLSQRRRRPAMLRAMLRPRPSHPAFTACVGALLMFALGLHGLGLHASIPALSALSLPVTAAAMALLLGGPALLRAAAGPLALLLLAVPWPVSVVAEVNALLKHFSAHAGATLAAWSSTLVVHVEGLVVLLRTPAGGTQAILIDEGCSGLRGLLTLLWLAGLLATARRWSHPWRPMGLVLTALLLAPAANVVRVALLLLIAGRWGVGVAESEPIHALAGWLPILAAAGVLMVLSRGNGHDSPTMPAPTRTPRAHPTRRRRPSHLGLALTASMMLAGLLWISLGHRAVAQRPDDDERTTPLARLAMTIHTPAGQWTGRDLPMNQRELAMLGAADHLYRTYSDGDGQSAEVLIIRTTGEGGVHPPEFCLAGIGQEVLDRRERTLTVAGATGRRGERTFAEVLTRRGPTLALHAYVYRAGDGVSRTHLPSHVMACLRDRLAGGTGEAALVRFSVDTADGSDLARARRRLDMALTAMWADVDAALR